MSLKVLIGCSTGEVMRMASSSPMIAKNRPYLPPEVLAHAVSPEAIADVIVSLVGDSATPVSGAVVPAYGG